MMGEHDLIRLLRNLHLGGELYPEDLTRSKNLDIFVMTFICQVCKQCQALNPPI